MSRAGYLAPAVLAVLCSCSSGWSTASRRANSRFVEHLRAKKRKKHSTTCNEPSKDKELLDMITPWRQAILGTPRILCAVYSHTGSEKNQQAQLDTWGKKCDKFILFSNDEPAESEVLSEHTTVIQPEHGPEAYDNMYHKVRAIWRFIFYTYSSEYDFFSICGDDTYMIVDNLRLVLVVCTCHCVVLC